MDEWFGSATSNENGSASVTTRPIFLPDPGGQLVNEVEMEFQWHPGFAMVQQQKNVESLHCSAAAKGFQPLLEISTRSRDNLGIRLSAFNLTLRTPAANEPVTVEAAFQSSKVYSESGQQQHLLTMKDGRRIKAEVRELAGESIDSFRFEEREWGLTPRTSFYDYLYLRALCDTMREDDSLLKRFANFVGFTDIAFNPKRSFNCQARSCALFIGLGGIEKVDLLLANPDSLIAVFIERQYGCEPPNDRLF
jgi:hypothetical protein